jgi:hypothetical protein
VELLSSGLKDDDMVFNPTWPRQSGDNMEYGGLAVRYRGRTGKLALKAVELERGTASTPGIRSTCPAPESTFSTLYGTIGAARKVDDVM